MRFICQPDSQQAEGRCHSLLRCSCITQHTWNHDSSKKCRFRVLAHHRSLRGESVIPWKSPFIRWGAYDGISTLRNLCAVLQELRSEIELEVLGDTEELQMSFTTICPNGTVFPDLKRCTNIKPGETVCYYALHFSCTTFLEQKISRCCSTYTNKEGKWLWL